MFKDIACLTEGTWDQNMVTGFLRKRGNIIVHLTVNDLARCQVINTGVNSGTMKHDQMKHVETKLCRKGRQGDAIFVGL